MRMAGIVVGIVLVLLGLFWVLQGANVIGGSAVMSGSTQWLWTGVVVAIVGAAVAIWAWRRTT